MPIVFVLIGSTVLTAALSLIGGILFLTDTKVAKKVQEFGPLIAFIILIFTVFGDIIPEILENESLPPLEMIGLIAAGFIGCGIVGWVLGHFHHHADAHHIADRPEHSKHKTLKITKMNKPDNTEKNRIEAKTMLIVDSVHNITDGIVIGVSFIANPAVGLATCLATIAHEIPQEVGDFSIMKKAKINRESIIRYQFLSALLLVPAALLAYLLGDSIEAVLPIVLSVIAGFLLYIAFSELYYLIDLVRSKLPKQLK